MTTQERLQRKLARQLRRSHRGDFPLACERTNEEGDTVYVFVDSTHRVFSTAQGGEVERLERLPVPDLIELTARPYRGQAARQLFIDVIFPHLHTAKQPSSREVEPARDTETTLPPSEWDHQEEETPIRR